MENRVLRNGEYASHDHADGDGVGNLVKSDGKPQSVAASQLRWGFGGCDDSPVDQEQEVNQRYDEHDYGKQQRDAYPQLGTTKDLSPESGEAAPFKICR